MRYLFLIILFAGLVSCSQDLTLAPEEAVNAPESLIFGDFFGFCLGDACVVIYKLENGKLYRDVHASFESMLNDPYTGVFEEVSQEEFDIADGLIDLIPAYLKQQPDSTFGNPDAYDQGGFYVNYQEGNTQGVWRLDHDGQNLPAQLRDFASALRTSMAALRNRL